MSWLFDGVPQDIIDKADAVAYNEQIGREHALAGDLLPRERIDSIDDVRRLISEPKLTVQLREDILRRLGRGMFPETAASRSGVPTELFNRWLNMGTKGLEPYATFYREMCEAEALWEETINERIQEEGDATDLRFLLERRASRPLLAEKAKAGGARYRKQQALEVENTHNFDFTKLSDDKKRAILAELAAQPALPPETTHSTLERLAAPPSKKDVIDNKP